MNGGNQKGNAFGFKLGTLLKLVETKSLDNKISLLHYLIQIFNEKYSTEDLINFRDEISSVLNTKGGF